MRFMLATCIFITALVGCSPPDKTSDYAKAALAQPMFVRFSDPIELIVPPDAFESARFLSNISGSSNLTNRGVPDLSDCRREIQFAVRNLSTAPNSRQILEFLRKNYFVDAVNYRADFVERGITGRGADGTVYTMDIPRPETFRCITYNYKLAAHLKGPSGAAIPIGALHRGGIARLGARKMTKWTYQKGYETPIPGKGNVQIFAGTFTYTVVKDTQTFPGLSFNGEGTVAMKMWLNPDNGQWTVEEWKF